MYCLRLVLFSALLGGLAAGCGENQPNAPTLAAETDADFSKNTADMMKAANSGMDLKKVRASAAPKSTRKIGRRK